MPRIRTVKPEFFRHEGLQDLEIENPGEYPMFVFEGLWLLCDSQGVFPYQPRQIHLDILPFLPFDMAKTLGVLVNAGFIETYAVDGHTYGLIPTFNKHQRLSGKEAQDGDRYPNPPQKGPVYIEEKQQGSTVETTVKQQGSIGEAVEKDQSFTNVQEREKEKERERTKSAREAHPELSHIELPEKDSEPPAIKILSTWYRRFHTETCRTIMPDEKDRLAAVLALERLGGDETVALECVAMYWDHWKDFWFAVRQSDRKKNPGARRPDHNFRNFCSNITSCVSNQEKVEIIEGAF